MSVQLVTVLLPDFDHLWSLADHILVSLPSWFGSGCRPAQGLWLGIVQRLNFSMAFLVLNLASGSPALDRGLVWLSP
jgi:hypothetical protein